ncbi:PREDICTED: ferric reduction oxidase 8, mitochondrial [Nelumbo nucifera]|uniref:Ferric reduction oxidase 8, mitochondrial n=1 Tax=Nelumbo nucifera TaxID=4432 RepID=A0A1U7ZJY1_NELNU|nr:PREDICTED: ferric reduction oxidase 8, mitochondrial [Nelumbo nucifera]
MPESKKRRRKKTDMPMTSILLTVLKVLMILIFASWVCLWLLKPTELWTKSWHKAEDSARNTFFGYNGLDFSVYSFPIIAVAIIGFIYMHLRAREPTRRQKRFPITTLSNPVIVHSPLGIISTWELLIAALFVLFLLWTIYVHISKDFKKLTPPKSLKLEVWQIKFMRVGIRFGLLAEACLALLLFPILRGMALFRLFGLQFEASVRYHVWFGTAMIFFATLHGSSSLFIWGVKHRLQDEMWLWQKTGRIYLAGEIALATGLVIWITSLPQIRRKRFELFYNTHHLYAVFLVFFLFHAGDRHFYMVFSGVFLFALDKLLRIIQSRPETCIISARIFPCKAVELILSKHPRLKYTPTSIIFLKIPSISKFQWHPFSIISSSCVDDDTISIIIRCEGQWTSTLYNTIHAALDSGADQGKCLQVAIEGPYGPASTNFLRYDSLLLVAGGIGITPFLSILQEIASSPKSKRSKFLTQIQLIYVVKKSQDISLLNPISSVILNQKAEQGNSIKLKLFVTQEERSSTTLREFLSELSQVQTVNFKRNYSTHAVFGFESLVWMASAAGFSSIIFLILLGCLSRAFLHHERKASEKNPSWVTDLLLICSFFIAVSCTTLALAFMRWRRMKKENFQVSQNQHKSTEAISIEAGDTLEEHEIHFGKRPNLQDILAQFPTQSGGSNIGVLVCGPESMKESVASFCKKNSQGPKIEAKRSKPYFSFHSLNFSL